MKQIINTEHIPIKLWLDDIEEGALKQAHNLSNLPFAFKHVALMPDSHEGYGMPIGGVLATKGVIIPNAVGVDIGCGMCAVKTNFNGIKVETIKQIMSGKRNRIPLGVNHHKKRKDESLMPEVDIVEGGVVEKQYQSALKQLGTLGGGNHFIEIQKGSDGYIWIMVHSGSRNIGLKVAEYYNRQARKLNERWFSGINPKWDLAFLPIEEPLAKDYMNEMKYCVEFAFASRKLMMQEIKEVFSEEFGDRFAELEFINIAHNYGAWENHFGENVIVHRKGATRAYEGEIGIIPGSQGTKSFIVQGKGNPESFKSCSHGAGRVMSRKKAIRELDLDAEIAKLDQKGIIHGIRHKSDLDEASSAYKDIDVVMQNQNDLVDILVELTPLAVVKG